MTTPEITKEQALEIGRKMAPQFIQFFNNIVNTVKEVINDVQTNPEKYFPEETIPEVELSWFYHARDYFEFLESKTMTKPGQVMFYVTLRSRFPETFVGQQVETVVRGLIEEGYADIFFFPYVEK